MSNEEDETAYDQDDEEMAALEQYKGSNIFARWYREVFLPNGGCIQSPDPHMLWDDLKDEFSFWLEDIESERQAAAKKLSERTFEHWYAHVYRVLVHRELDKRPVLLRDPGHVPSLRLL